MENILKTKTLVQRILMRHEDLKNLRVPYEDLITDCVNLTRPGLTGFDSTTQEGEQRGKVIYDGTGVSSLRTMSRGMQGHLCSPAIDWLNYQAHDVRLRGNDNVNRWIDAVLPDMLNYYHECKFYEKVQPIFRHVFSVGTVVVLFEEDLKTGLVKITVPHPRDNYIAEDEDGNASIYHRTKSFTALQAARRFDRKLLSQSLNRSLDNGQFFNKYDFIQAIYPKDDFLIEDQDPRENWVVYWVQKDHEKNQQPQGKPVATEHFEIEPKAVWRYEKNDDEVYGRSPAANSIVDILQLQQISLTLMKSAQKYGDPPIWAPATLRGRVYRKPGGITYYDNPQQQVSELYRMSGGYPISLEWRQVVKEAVEDHFFVRLFLMMDRMERKEVKVIEVLEKVGEKAVLLGPTLERMQGDFFNKVDDFLAHTRMKKADWGKQIPDEIKRSQNRLLLTPQLVGPLQQLQKSLHQRRKINDALATAAPVFEWWPDSRDKVNADLTVENILEEGGMPQKNIRTDKEVAKIRQARAEAEQMQMMAEYGPQMLKSLPKEKGEGGSMLNKLTEATE